jgi:chemotaxis response regulator CheB
MIQYARKAIISQRQVPMKRIFLLSSHPLFGQGVESLLRRESGFDIVGLETDIDRAVARIKRLRPDAVVVDSNEAIPDPALVVMRILREGLDTRVIGVNLWNNVVCVYHGQQRVLKEVQDLVQAIQGESLSSKPSSAKGRRSSLESALKLSLQLPWNKTQRK